MKLPNNLYLFLIASFIILIIPNLLQTGMFVDGLWYAVISNNEANGIGSFWYPQFTKTMYPVFNEHPPLVFGIQSILYRILGNKLFVEKIYALIIIIVTLILINYLWKLLFERDEKLKEMGFLPMLIWLMHESVYIYYPNNLLECTQGVFILLSIILMLNGLKTDNYLSSILLISGSALCLLLSFLSKGFTGLFPLIFIPVYYFIFKNIPFKKALTLSLLLILTLLLFSFLLLLNENAYANLISYLNTQVIAAISGSRYENIQLNRFYILRRYFEVSILPVLFILGLGAFSYYRYKQFACLKYKKEILFFLIISLSAIIPITISLKQATYYLLTALPFSSIMLALIIAGNNTIFSKLRISKKIKYFGLALTLTGIIISLTRVNTINKRDKVLINDLSQISQTIEKGSVIGCMTQSKELSLYGYLMRLYSVSADTLHPFGHPYLIVDSESLKQTSGFEKINCNTQKFFLYKNLK